jgi:hypothetical protein
MATLDDEDVTAEEDPRTARIVRRMRLFVGVSTAIMLIGFVLVMSVIVWRLVKAQPASDAGRLTGVPTAPLQNGQQLTGSLPIPAGTKITGTTSDGQRLFVTTEAQDGRPAIHVLDATTLGYLGRVDANAP